MKLEIKNTNKKTLPIIAGLLVVAVGILPFLFSSNQSSFEDITDENISEVKVLSSSGITDPSGSISHSNTTMAVPADHAEKQLHHTDEKIKQQHQGADTHSASNKQQEPNENNIDSSNKQESHVEVSHSNEVNVNATTQASEAGTEVVAENVMTDRVCYEFGPILSDVQKSELDIRLRSDGIMSTLQFKNVQKELGYWVFLPPQRSVAIGRLKVEEIKLKGIKDVNLLVNHEPKLAISLGIFKDEKNAYSRMLKAQSLGFDAKMDLRHIEENQMWLVLESARKNDLTEQAWAELLKQHSPIELKAINCP